MRNSLCKLHIIVHPKSILFGRVLYLFCTEMLIKWICRGNLGIADSGYGESFRGKKQKKEHGYENKN